MRRMHAKRIPVQRRTPFHFAGIDLDAPHMIQQTTMLWHDSLMMMMKKMMTAETHGFLRCHTLMGMYPRVVDNESF